MDLPEKRIFCIIKQGKKTREVTSPGPWPLIKVIGIGTRNQINLSTQECLREFGEKLMRVLKGRPIGASAADKVLDKGKTYSSWN